MNELGVRSQTVSDISVFCNLCFETEIWFGIDGGGVFPCILQSVFHTDFIDAWDFNEDMYFRQESFLAVFQTRRVWAH